MFFPKAGYKQTNRKRGSKTATDIKEDVTDSVAFLGDYPKRKDEAYTYNCVKCYICLC